MKWGLLSVGERIEGLFEVVAVEVSVVFLGGIEDSQLTVVAVICRLLASSSGKLLLAVVQTALDKARREVEVSSSGETVEQIEVLLARGATIGSLGSQALTLEVTTTLDERGEHLLGAQHGPADERSHHDERDKRGTTH